MNISHVERREKELRTRAEEIRSRANDCEAKGDPEWMWKSIDRDMKEWQKEWDQVAAERKQYENGKAFMSKMGGNAGSLAETKAVTGLGISESDYKGLFEAVQRKLPSFKVEAKTTPFGEGSFTSGGLPPVLLPHLTQQLPYEPDDLFAHFIQTPAPQASSVEWIQHTGNTNPAAPTAELTLKPDLDMQLTTHSTSFTKVAALQSLSTEAISDFSHFMQFVPGEMFRALRDAITNQVANGNGTPPNMQGLIGSSGVLTRSLGSDTPVDCLRKSFNDLRVGSSFANASIAAMHPTTWADIQLQKATNGLYLLNPNDPNSIGSLTDIFGVKVIQNSYIPAGTAIVADTSKAVLAWTRQAPSLEINQFGTNEFNENYVTFRVETRVAIGLMFPTAVNIVTGLPAS